MNKKRGIIIAVLLVAVATVLAVLYINGNNTENEGNVSTIEQQPSETQTNAQELNEEAIEQPSVEGGAYVDYTPQRFAALSEDDRAVLFFHAQWCSTCKMLNDDIVANQANIPNGTTIFKVDFDQATELKQEHGVTIQHTLVAVDSNGSQIDKWAQSPSLDALLARLNN